MAENFSAKNNIQNQGLSIAFIEKRNDFAFHHKQIMAKHGRFQMHIQNTLFKIELFGIPGNCFTHFGLPTANDPGFPHLFIYLQCFQVILNGLGKFLWFMAAHGCRVSGDFYVSILNCEKSVLDRHLSQYRFQPVPVRVGNKYLPEMIFGDKSQ